MGISTTDIHHHELDELMEIARRLEVWASEVKKPAAHTLRSLVRDLQRSATRLLIVGTNLAISQTLAEEKARQTETLVRAESLPSWARPFYLEQLARRAEEENLLRTLDRFSSCAIDPTG